MVDVRELVQDLSTGLLSSPIIFPADPELGKPKKKVHPISEITKLALPNVLGYLAVMSTSVIAVLCVSRLHNTEMLGACGIANLVSGICCHSIALGICSVMDTLVSQAYGARNLERASLVLNYVRVICLACAVPCIALLLMTRSILTGALAQNELVSNQAHDFIMGTMLGVLPSFWFYCSAGYARNLQLSNLVMAINVAALPVQGLACYLLVNVYNCGLFGAGVSMSIYGLFRFGVMEAYLISHPKLLGYNWNVFKANFVFGEMMDVLTRSIPGAMCMWVEWWSYELLAAIIGILGPAALAAHVAATSVLSTSYMVPLGVGSAASVLVGASLGEGNGALAKVYSQYSVGMALVLPLVYSSGIYTFRNQICEFYATDAQVGSILHSLLWILELFVIFDSVNCTVEGILRGAGLQNITIRYKAFFCCGYLLVFGWIASRLAGVISVWTVNLSAFIGSALYGLYVLKQVNFHERAIVATKEATFSH